MLHKIHLIIGLLSLVKTIYAQSDLEFKIDELFFHLSKTESIFEFRKELQKDPNFSDIKDSGWPGISTMISANFKYNRLLNYIGNNRDIEMIVYKPSQDNGNNISMWIDFNYPSNQVVNCENEFKELFDYFGKSSYKYEHFKTEISERYDFYLNQLSYIKKQPIIKVVYLYSSSSILGPATYEFSIGLEIY
ncbi:MAG: hypothetical protein ABJC12_02780 [Saprospiraceae bacterium]